MADKKEQYYSPPPKVGKWEGFKTFIWNSETSQFLGRTGGSWAKILLFYVLFYAALSGFFAAMLAVFYQTLDDHSPKWKLDSSLIGSNPGLGFRPMPPESNVESTLIWYKASDSNNYKLWTDEINKFISVYTKEDMKQEGDRKMRCSYDNVPKEDDTKTCIVDVESWYPCTPLNDYNYKSSAPCIFLKLNKIFNWRPNYFNDSEHLPNKMPEELKNHIKNERTRNPKALNTVWVSCEGENPADQENIGPIQYKPMRGFPGYFFPFKNLEGYLSPLVAVYFERPTRGVLINIECKAWAHNIQHDRAERRGSVHFELQVD